MSPRTTKKTRDADLIRAGLRRALRSTCAACGRPVLVGLDADVLAFDATTETWTATPADEVLAFSAGRASYVLRGYAPDHELERRHRVHVLASPGASSSGGRVVLAHECGSPTRPAPRPPTALWGPDDAPPY